MTLKPMVRAVAYACELIGWEWRNQRAAAMEAAAAQSTPKINIATTA
jgi:hypothetical protein